VFATTRRPIVFTGQQVGPFRSRWGRKVVAATLTRAAFVGLREPTESVEFCKRARLDANRYCVMGDDSFGLAPRPIEHAVGLLKSYGLTAGSYLAVNVRRGFYAQEHGDHLAVIARLVSSIAKRLGLAVGFVPISRNVVDSDIHSGQELAKWIDPAVPYSVIGSPDLTPDLVKGVLGQAFGAVGVSYHFCTFALSSGVPAVCIHAGNYYGQKAEGLRRFWDDDRLAVPLARSMPESVEAEIASTLTDQTLRNRLPALARKAVGQWENVFDEQVKTLLGTHEVKGSAFSHA
jgi:polysaccharide pyruvyl transferase WcaK-like protein